ncbi:MAG: VOC family protein [Rhodoglobus sp.]
MLEISDLRPFIPALDVARSVRFYRALGWDVVDVGPGLQLITASEQHFYLQDFPDRHVAENTMLHLTVEDAAAWHDHVAAMIRADPDLGCRVQPPRRQDYGALVTFVHDPAGVLLHFCQWD